MEDIFECAKGALEAIVEETKMPIVVPPFNENTVLTWLSGTSYILPLDKLILKIPKLTVPNSKRLFFIDDESHSQYANEMHYLEQFKGNPGVVDVKSMGHIKFHRLDVPYILMRRYDGSLDTFAGNEDDEKLDLNHILKYTIHLSDTLIGIHNQKILYADLKPSNCLVDLKADNCILTDFQHTCPIDTTQKPGGTRYFYAPERIFPQPGMLSYKDDVWGLGMVMFSMITGMTTEDICETLNDMGSGEDTTRFWTHIAWSGSMLSVAAICNFYKGFEEDIKKRDHTITLGNKKNLYDLLFYKVLTPVEKRISMSEFNSELRQFSQLYN
jgi:serine/threonine protein kinase